MLILLQHVWWQAWNMDGDGMRKTAAMRAGWDCLKDALA